MTVAQQTVTTGSVLVNTLPTSRATFFDLLAVSGTSAALHSHADSKVVGGLFLVVLRSSFCTLHEEYSLHLYVHIDDNSDHMYRFCPPDVTVLYQVKSSYIPIILYICYVC